MFHKIPKPKSAFHYPGNYSDYKVLDKLPRNNSSPWFHLEFQRSPNLSQPEQWRQNPPWHLQHGWSWRPRRREPSHPCPCSGGDRCPSPSFARWSSIHWKKEESLGQSIKINRCVRGREYGNIYIYIYLFLLLTSDASNWVSDPAPEQLRELHRRPCYLVQIRTPLLFVLPHFPGIQLPS